MTSFPQIDTLRTSVSVKTREAGLHHRRTRAYAKLSTLGTRRSPRWPVRVFRCAKRRVTGRWAGGGALT